MNRFENDATVDPVDVTESALTPEVLAALIALSADWEAENSCRGYVKNTAEDIAGNRVFLAKNGDSVVGYLFGHICLTEKSTSVAAEGTPYFELEELYVKPALRSRGIGWKLVACLEETVSGEVEYIMLSTATKNWRAILHFYLDELDMTFWNARLYKKLPSSLSHKA